VHFVPFTVEFDNANIKYPQFTLLKVCSANRYGCLLEVVQLLTDLGLVIVKGFIVSDGQWFFRRLSAPLTASSPLKTSDS